MFRISKLAFASAFLASAFLLFASHSFAQTDSVRRAEGSEVIVTGFPDEGITPIPSEQIAKPRIQQLEAIAQPTKAAAFTPSTHYYTQSGLDVGYTFLNIRGFDQRRLSILVNGVPQNDPEDHNVYWIDMPDIMSSTGRIQIQRGAGSAFYGPPAIGGSINVETEFPALPFLTLTGGYGSYNTQKYMLEGASGVIGDNWLLYGKLSRTTTDGYRNHAFIDLNSYHISLKHVGEKHTLQFNAFGGPIKDGLDYYGLFPEYGIGDLRNEDLRKYNVSESFYYERRPEEKEYFFQPHFEVLSSYELDPVTTLKNTAFYVQGYGYFDYDGTWASGSRYFRLTKPYADAYGFTPLSDTLKSLGNEIIRSTVENKQFGWLPRVEWKLPQSDIYLGAEVRIHRSLHYGNLLKADIKPTDLDPEYRYYEYNGGKDIFSPYGAMSYRFEDGTTLFGSLQLVAQKYRFDNEKPVYIDSVIAQSEGFTPGWRSYEFEVAYTFLNPRLGIGLQLTKALDGFVSFALTSREPRLGDYYHGESFSRPNFASQNRDVFDFNSPNIRPERLMDLEVGLDLKQVQLANNYDIRGSINGYYMGFKDELVKTGSDVTFGEPQLTNAQATEHYGVEGSFDLRMPYGLSLELNAGASKHRFTTFSFDTVDLAEKTPIGFPSLTGSVVLGYKPIDEIGISLFGRYVGSTFGDLENTETYRNPDYFVADAILTLRAPETVMKNLELKLQVNNIFDRLYTTYADAGVGFFVAAPRHLFASLSVGI